MTYVTYFIVFAAIIIIFFILYKIFRFIISLLLIGLFLVIAYFTNPTEEQHRHAAVQKAERTRSTNPAPMPCAACATASRPTSPD